MISIQINKDLKDSIYIQIYKQIKNGIISSEILPNEKLPSKRILADSLSVSLNTIIEAYNLLIDEGYITSIPKKGYYVVDYLLTSTNIKRNRELLKENNKLKYDLTTKNIDASIFPYYTYSKISKNIINNDLNIIYKTDNMGDIALRNTISKYLFDTKGIIANPNNIIIGSGIEYLLTLLISILPCKNYRIENPGYSKLKTILSNNNCNISYSNIDLDGAYLNDTNFDCIYLTPANQFPTGVKMSLQRKIDIINHCKNKYIIEDDFDSEFKYLVNTSTSLFSLSSDNVIYMSTFSRTIAPSLRISYMILPDKLIQYYKNKYMYYSSTVSTLDQKILNEFIVNGSYSRHLNKTKLLYQEKRKLILKLLKEYGFDALDGGYLSLLLKIDYPSNFKKLCNEANLEISTIDDYSLTNEHTNTIIIGYSAISFSDIKPAIDILVKIIKRI